jgi:hypothetical protein
MQIIYPRTPLPIALDRYDGCSKSMDELAGIMGRGSADARSPGPSAVFKCPRSGLFEYRLVRFSPEGGCFARNHFKRSVSARFIAYEASSHRTSPRGSSWVQALPGKFRGNHNPGFDRGNFCPFPGAYLGSHTPGIPGISGSTWEHTHPGAYSGRETRVFPGGRWEPRSQPRSWPRKNPGTGWIPGFSRVVLLGVANEDTRLTRGGVLTPREVQLHST